MFLCASSNMKISGLLTLVGGLYLKMVHLSILYDSVATLQPTRPLVHNVICEAVGKFVGTGGL